MRRGTTPSITMNFPCPVSDFDLLYVTIKQRGIAVIERDLSGIEINGNKGIIHLTQEETLQLTPCKALYLQVRGTMGEDAYASQVFEIDVKDVLKDGVI